jgi:hypothetical protein
MMSAQLRCSHFGLAGEGGLLFQEMQTKQGDLLLRGKVTTLTSHGMSTSRVLPLTPRKANSSSG